MKHAASLLTPLLVAGCASHQPSPDSPRVIYAVPQSEAFAIAHQAIVSAPRGYALGEFRITTIHDHNAIPDQLIGYRLVYHGWYYVHTFTQNLYVIPVAGVGAGGQEINGFRFLITGAGPVVGYAFVRAAAQDTSLAKTLNAALDSTGTTSLVTNLRIRPYDENLGR
jgi:hypothetical protein